MILKKLSIQNYRIYRDISIDFASGDKNITVIIGNHSVGKNTLLNAINWCLYGVELYKNPYDLNLPIFNLKTAHLADIGHEIEVSVEMVFEDDGELLTFHRIQGFKKESERLNQLYNNIEVIKQVGNDVIIEKDPDHVIRKKIPKEMLNLFIIKDHMFYEFFRGEVYKKFIGFSQLNILKDSIKHMKVMKRKYEYIYSLQNDEESEIIRKIEFCDRSIEAANEIYNNLKEDNIKKTEALVNEKLSDFYDINIDIAKGDLKVFLKGSSYGEISANHLSYGEIYLISLAFIISIHSIHPIQFPIFLESFHVLFDRYLHDGSRFRDLYSELILDLSSQKQTVLILTSLDYLDFGNMLDEAIGRTYMIDFNCDDNGEESIIISDEEIIRKRHFF